MVVTGLLKYNVKIENELTYLRIMQSGELYY
jgi:hypothetical protein